MKTEKTYTDDHQVKLKTEIESDLVEQFKRRAARQIARSTRIPGFRPGKAPYNMVLSYVGEDRIFQESIDLLVEDIYPKILDSEEINPGVQVRSIISPVRIHWCSSSLCHLTPKLSLKERMS